jgi:hypothetical protein
VKMTASSSDAGCCRATTVRRGSLDVQLVLLGLRQCCVIAGQGDEVFGVVVHCARVLQHGELADGAVSERRPESCVHQLHKLRSSWSATI